MDKRLISPRDSGMDRRATVKSRIHPALTFLLIAALACNLPVTSTPAEGTEPAGVRLELQAYAVRLEPGAITYSVRLTNRGNVELSDLMLEFDVPSGGIVQQVRTTPLNSQMQQGNEQVSWAIPHLPANVLVGPFSYRVAIENAPGPVEARASWQLPEQGTASASVSTVEEATLTETTTVMAAGPLTEIPGSGVQYFVPFGDRGQVTLQRLEEDPGGGVPDELAWVGAYQVTKEKPGSAIFVVPLRSPVPPFTLVRVFADEGDGFREQTVMGSVAPDGLHASFAADSASKYALGVDELRLNTASTTLVVEVGQSLASQASQGLFDFESIFGKTNGLLDLINSLRTDVVVIDTGDGWFVIDTPIGGDPPSSGDCAEDTQGLTCYFEDGSGGPCDGHGGGVTTVSYETGARESTCADGTVITECHDEDGDGYCVGYDSNDDDPNVHFAPVPGPCPHGVCFSQAGTDELYSVGQLDGLATSIVGLIDLRGLTQQQRVDLASPPSAQVQAPGPRLDASNMRAVVAVIENRIVLLFPSGQQIEVVIAPFKTTGVASTPGAATESPSETAAATLTPTPTAPPPPPTETFTPKPPPPPPPDTDGPGIKNVSAAPDPIYVTKPKGCAPNASIISAVVSDPSGVASVVLIYKGISAGSVSMSNVGGNQWQAQIGPFDTAGMVNYQIQATDTLGNQSNTGGFSLTVLACVP